MLTTAAFAEIAALMGDPSRANMLAELMDGRARTARELAEAAGVTAPTASAHLARLTQAGLLAVTQQGRHRYHRLSTPGVAQMLEAVMAVATAAAPASPPPRRRIVPGPHDAAMRQARTCYDHLAGQLAVAIADRMAERGHIELSHDGGALTDAGAGFLRALGVQVDRTRTRRVFCRPCLDWSERRLHIAGSLGAALCDACLAQGWVRRRNGTRALAITQAGQLAFAREFDLRLQQA